jgi:thiamine biosynthesis protein ThiI
LPYEDCCTVFVPKHPLTRPGLEKIVRAEQALDREQLIRSALHSVERLVIG